MELNSTSTSFFIMGGLLLVISIVFMQFPPKKVNGLYGYRTPRSMKSQEAWDFAQGVSAKYLMWYAIAHLVPGIVLLFVDTSHWAEWMPLFILLPITLGGAVLMIVQVERKLKRRFDE